MKGLKDAILVAVLVAFTGAAAASCTAQSSPDGTARSGPDSTALRALVDSIMPQIERVSGMRERHPVRFARPTRAQVKTYLEQELNRHFPDGQLTATRDMYADLGLVPDTLNLRRLMLDLYMEQVIGYYDPASKTLYVVKGVPRDSIVPVLSHELVHALQDQYVNLDSLISRKRGNDRQSAAQAAMEGQATVLMIALMGQRIGQPVDIAKLPDLGDKWGPVLQAGYRRYPVFRRAPRIIQETLLFPYIRGASFMQALARAAEARGAKGPPPLPFDSLLPQSTEQVLYPTSKFIAQRDTPTNVTIGDAARGWHIRVQSTLGELETSIFLSQYLGNAAGTRDARGWDGDRIALLRGPQGQDALVWYSVWDDSASADRFAQAYRRTLADRHGRRGVVSRRQVQGRPVVAIVETPADARPRDVPAPALARLDTRRH
ncbi:MAG: hypothetical protein P8Z36_12990 [Gemmatimonadota bacterium]